MLWLTRLPKVLIDDGEVEITRQHGERIRIRKRGEADIWIDLLKAEYEGKSDRLTATLLIDNTVVTLKEYSDMYYIGGVGFKVRFDDRSGGDEVDIGMECDQRWLISREEQLDQSERVPRKE